MNNKIFSNNKDWFSYNSRTKQWFRVLVRGGGQGYLKEISIPLNPSIEETWDSPGVVPIMDIRVHITTPDPREKLLYTHALPIDVYMIMEREYGTSTTKSLVHDDLLSMISIEELVWSYRKFNSPIKVPIIINPNPPAINLYGSSPCDKRSLSDRLKPFPELFTPPPHELIGNHYV